MNDVTIIGCGDIGRRVARLHRLRGDQVSGWVRSPESAQRLQQLGIATIRADLDRPLVQIPVPQPRTLLYYFAPPPAQGTSDPRLQCFLQQLTTDGGPAKIVYISTTGVYGNTHGEWIDENAPTEASTERAQRRLWAERHLRAWGQDHGVAIVVLRVPGIYGPGRLPIERLREELPVVRASECPYTNRIHSEDLTHTCVAAMDRASDGALYNVSDGHPGTMTDYFNQVADLLGLPRPPTVSLAEARQVLSPGMVSYLSESRKISNQKLLSELGVTLRYPTLAQGLAASVDHTQL